MIKIPKTQSQLETELDDQINILIKRCFDFDKGDILEAKEISNKLRLLLHDSKSKNGNKSLLGQLSKLNQVKFVSYFRKFEFEGIDLQKNYIVTQLQGNLLHKYIPNFLNLGFYSRKGFEKWWNEEIAKDETDQFFNRSKIVLEVAESDGGTHVDQDLHKDYYQLKYSNSQKLMYRKSSDQNFIDYSNSIPYIIRQIAHETIVSCGYQYNYNPQDYYIGRTLNMVGLIIEKTEE